MIRHLARHLRPALRVLLRDRTLAVFAVVALGLGIGLTTIVFSIVHGMFFRSLPFKDGERLVRLESSNLAGQRFPVSVHDFADWRSMQTSFDDLAAWVGVSLNLSGDEGLPERYNGAYVSANFFEVVAVSPALGRGFLPSEERLGAELVAVISDSMWHQRFGGDPKVLGRPIRIYGQPGTIVGVMPPGFRFPLNQNLWVPLVVDPSRFERGQGWPLQVLGRLKRGVSLEKASAELSVISARLAEAHPETNRGIRGVLTPYVEGYTDQERRRTHLLMLGLVLGVLLIAIFNVANLLLAKSAVRSKEAALRVALGGTRPQVLSQLLLESLLLAVGGAIAGLGVAKLGIHLYVQATQDTPPPFWQGVHLDAQSYLFVAVVTLASGILSGLLPALRSTFGSTGDLLKDSSPGSTSRRVGRLSRGLVIGQVALSYALLLATALMVTSLLTISRREIGFDPGGLLTAELSLYGNEYPDGASQARAFEELSRKITELPSIGDLGLTSSLPGGRTLKAYFEVEGETYASETERPVTRWAVVTPRLFSVLDCRLLSGRLLEDGDRADTLPVAVVTRSFAESYFSNDDAVGRRIGIDLDDGGKRWVTIVGVIADVLVGGSADNNYRSAFLPLAQYPQSGMTFVLRVRGDSANAISSVRRTVATFNRDLPLYDVKTLDQVLAEDVRSYSVAGGLFSAFGAIALVLASFGVYALLTLHVRSRQRELGIRMALGEGPRSLAGGVMAQALVLVGMGLLIGLALALSFSESLAGFLFGVNVHDPVSFIVAALALLGAAVLASLSPAYRAMRVEPMAVLRPE